MESDYILDASPISKFSAKWQSPERNISPEKIQLRQVGFNEDVDEGRPEVPAQPPEMFIRPSNMHLLIGFMNFVGQCSYELDRVLLNLFERVLQITFKMPLRGFPDIESARLAILRAAAKAIPQVMRNNMVQREAHQIVTGFFSDSESPLIKDFYSALDNAIQQDQVVAQAIFFRYLRDDQKAEIFTLIKEKLFSNQDSSHQKLMLSVLNYLISLEQNTFSGCHLDEDQNMKLQKLCLRACKQFIKNRMSFEWLKTPYLHLLFKLLASQEDQGKSELSPTDMFVYLIRRCLDCQRPLITHKQLGSLMHMLLEITEQDLIKQKKNYQEKLLRILETLGVLCTQIDLKKLNENIFEQISTEVAVIEAADQQLHNHATGKCRPLKYMYQNLQGQAYFEESIARLGVLELNIRKGGGYRVALEATAIFQFIQKLTKFVHQQNLSGQLPSLISYITTLMRLVINNIGPNELILSSSGPIVSLKSSIQTLIPKLLQSVTKFYDVDSNLNHHLQNIMQFILVDIKKLGPNQEVFEFFIEELTKFFKRRKVTFLFCDIVEMVFKQLNPIKQQPFLAHGPRGDNYLAKQHYRFLKVLVDTFNEIIVEQMWTFSEGELSKMLEALVACMQNDKETQDEQKSYFLQLWVLLAQCQVQQMSSIYLKYQLAKLASITPTFAYDQEFSMMIRVGFRKDSLEAFSSQVFAQLEQEMQEKIEKGNIKSFRVISNLQSTQRSDQKHEAYEQAKNQHMKDPLELSDDNGEDEGMPANPMMQMDTESLLYFSEKVFLAIFTYTSLLRLKYEKGVHKSSLVETAINIVQKDKIYMRLAESGQASGKDSPINTPLGKQLEAVTRSIFQVQIAKLRMRYCFFQWEANLDQSVITDVNILLKAKCSHALTVRYMADALLSVYTENFPILLLKQSVMFTFLDILTALDRMLLMTYDAVSHTATLQLSKDQITLVPEKELQAQILTAMTELMTSLFLKSAIIGLTELQSIFRYYQTLYCEEAAKSEFLKEPFGILFFNQLLDKFNMHMVEPKNNTRGIVNYNQLRVCSVVNPSLFSKIVDGLQSQSFQEQTLLNFTKKRLSSETNSLQSIKPFPAPERQEAANNISTFMDEREKHNEYIKEKIAQLDPRESILKQKNIGMVTYNKIFVELAEKACRATLYIDWVQHVTHIMTFATKKQLKDFNLNFLQHLIETKEVFKSPIMTSRRDLQKSGFRRQSTLDNFETKMLSSLGAKIKEHVKQVSIMELVNIKMPELMKQMKTKQSQNAFISSKCKKISEAFGSILALLEYMECNDCQSYKIFKSQVIQFLLYIPTLSFSRELIQQGLFPVIKRLQSTQTCLKPFLFEKMVETLPTAVDQLMTKLMVSDIINNKVESKGFIKLRNKVHTMISLNKRDEFLYNAPTNLSKNDYSLFDDNSSLKLLCEKMKFHNLWQQERNPKQICLSIIELVHTLMDDHLYTMIPRNMQTSLKHLGTTFLNLVRDGRGKFLVKLTNKLRPQIKMCLLILKFGHLLLQLFKMAEKQGSSFGTMSQIHRELRNNLQTFSLDFFTQLDEVSFQRKAQGKIKEEVQLCEDLKFLVVNNFDLTGENATTTKKVFFINMIRLKMKIESNLRNDVMQTVSLFYLNQIKQSVMAWNFHDQMGPLEPTQFHISPEQSAILVNQRPLLALKMATQYGLKPEGAHAVNITSLFKSVGSMLAKGNFQLMKSGHGLSHFLARTTAFKAQKGVHTIGDLLQLSDDQALSKVLMKANLWVPSNFLPLLKLLSMQNHEKAGDYFRASLALKPLEYADPKTVIFYLPQLFQSLRIDASNQLKEFLVRKAKDSASLAHQILWFCKVESTLETGPGRKVILPVAENLNTIANKLYHVILSSGNILQSQRNFFETETKFFEKITAISGLLQPSQSKDEKKAIIREKLVEINDNIPECVYLPTNQECRVVGIVTNSGQPMQSAARVPILITFEVEDYPGPDSDQSLLRPEAIYSLLQNTLDALKVNHSNFSQLVADSPLFGRRPDNAEDLVLDKDENIFISGDKFTSVEEGKINASMENRMKAKKTLSELVNATNLKTSLTKNRFQSPVKSSSIQPTEKTPEGILKRPSKVENLNQVSLQLKLNVLRSHNEFYDASVEMMGNPQLQTHQDRLAILNSLKNEMPSEPKQTEALELIEMFLDTVKDVSTGIKTDMYASLKSRRSTRRLTQTPQSLLSITSQSRSDVRENPNNQYTAKKVVSCIFKVNDDLRQDILALQVIKLFQKAFKRADLDLYVAPYKCISNRTGPEKMLGGIIEVIPNSYSRDQLGKAFEINLFEYFLKRYGSESSDEFKAARFNFIKSLAAYCVVSYILQIKDRHNGNILIDESGHLIHIDFGFIYDWSPGKDMRFESANFKLTNEFIAILGGNTKAEAYKLFVTKVVQGFLAVREYSQEIIALTEMMIYSGFPCFKPNSQLNLESRFKKEMNNYEAAQYMKQLVLDAHGKWTTKVYDYIQYKQNKIVF